MEKAASSISELPQLKKVLVVGSVGRENALAWAIARFQEVEKVYVSPGNAGTKDQIGCHRLDIQESNNDNVSVVSSSSSSQIPFSLISGHGSTQE